MIKDAFQVPMVAIKFIEVRRSPKVTGTVAT